MPFSHTFPCRTRDSDNSYPSDFPAPLYLGLFALSYRSRTYQCSSALLHAMTLMPGTLLPARGLMTYTTSRCGLPPHLMPSSAPPRSCCEGGQQSVLPHPMSSCLVYAYHDRLMLWLWASRLHCWQVLKWVWQILCLVKSVPQKKKGYCSHIIIVVSKYYMGTATVP